MLKIMAPSSSCNIATRKKSFWFKEKSQGNPFKALLAGFSKE
jgi:hypothetical protein